MSIELEPNKTLQFTRPAQTGPIPPPQPANIECPLRIRNSDVSTVAFKIMTTDRHNFCVRPHLGTIQPNQTADVKIVLNSKAFPDDIDNPLSDVPKPKFMVLSMLLAPKDETKDLSDLPWTGENGDKGEGVIDLHKKKLKVKFVQEMRKSKPLPLISIEPFDLVPFERPLTRRLERVIVVRSLHVLPIAIKVKTNNRKRYTARPNISRLTPGQTVDITIGLIPMEEEPPLTFICTDKILIQTAVVTPDRADKPLLELFTPPTTKHAPPTEEHLAIGNHKIDVFYMRDPNTPGPISPQFMESPVDEDGKLRGLLSKTMYRFRRTSWRQ